MVRCQHLALKPELEFPGGRMADTGNDENHGVFREALQPLAGYHAVIGFAIGELVCFGNSLPQYLQYVFVTKPQVPKIILKDTNVDVSKLVVATLPRDIRLLFGPAVVACHSFKDGFCQQYAPNGYRQYCRNGSSHFPVSETGERSRQAYA